jgi:hypothetical protein
MIKEVQKVMKVWKHVASNALSLDLLDPALGEKVVPVVEDLHVVDDHEFVEVAAHFGPKSETKFLV